MVTESESVAAGSTTSNKQDFSTTNTQVENVDEADIVKTDGEYIYYVVNGVLHIVKADTFELVKGEALITFMVDGNERHIYEKYEKGGSLDTHPLRSA